MLFIAEVRTQQEKRIEVLPFSTTHPGFGSLLCVLNPLCVRDRGWSAGTDHDTARYLGCPLCILAIWILRTPRKRKQGQDVASDNALLPRVKDLNGSALLQLFIPRGARVSCRGRTNAVTVQLHELAWAPCHAQGRLHTRAVRGRGYGKTRLARARCANQSMDGWVLERRPPLAACALIPASKTRPGMHSRLLAERCYGTPAAETIRRMVGYTITRCTANVQKTGSSLFVR